MSITLLSRISAIAVIAGFSATAAMADDSKGQLYSVSFEMESANPVGPVGPLSTTFTLKHPAVLESYAVFCPGGAAGGVLVVDGGPLGPNGAAARGDPSTQVFSNLGPHLYFGFQASAEGVNYISSAHVGVPVSTTYSISINPANNTALNCTGYAVLRTL